VSTHLGTELNCYLVAENKVQRRLSVTGRSDRGPQKRPTGSEAAAGS